MSLSRRDLLVIGAAAMATSTATTDGASAEETKTISPQGGPPPLQLATDRRERTDGERVDTFDMRDYLAPKRMTMAMWDVAYALRHGPGGSFANYDRVLDETVERGYNTVRIDPMPQWLDFSTPEQTLTFADPKWPYQPWLWNSAISGPVGQWVIEFIEKLLRRPSLNYTLSAWWIVDPPPPVPAVRRRPKTFTEGAEMWAELLAQWRKRFGLDRLVYVDIANETPFFFPDFADRLKAATGAGWEAPILSVAQIDFVAKEINAALKFLRREFPDLRFTTSMHGDLRWLDIPVELDCLDVHFYSDADPRWTDRTRFNEFVDDGMFYKDTWFAELSRRSTLTARAMSPMLRARQRHKIATFSGWSRQRGAPLTTSEGWAAWYYIDSPRLDWGWLLEWASWTVQDAIDNGMWGWAPHDYVQPQFANWRDVNWHRGLNERFLRS